MSASTSNRSPSARPDQPVTGFVTIFGRRYRSDNLTGPDLTVRQTLRRLTSRQSEILAFISRTYATTGEGPSVRDLCRHFGWTSPNAPANHLLALERRGLIVRDPLTPRSVRPSPSASDRKEVA